MYLRVVRAAGGKGVKHEYVRIVEAYRENGKNKHRTIINLGRKDLLAAHLDLDKLNRLLHGETQTSENLRSENIQALDAWDWGQYSSRAACGPNSAWRACLTALAGVAATMTQASVSELLCWLPIG